MKNNVFSLNSSGSISSTITLPSYFQADTKTHSQYLSGYNSSISQPEDKVASSNLTNNNNNNSGSMRNLRDFNELSLINAITISDLEQLLKNAPATLLNTSPLATDVNRLQTANYHHQYQHQLKNLFDTNQFGSGGTGTLGTGTQGTGGDSLYDYDEDDDDMVGTDEADTGHESDKEDNKTGQTMTHGSSHSSSSSFTQKNGSKRVEAKTVSVLTANSANRGGGSVAPIVNEAHLSEDDKRKRRAIANSNERRRMQSINTGFQTLKGLIPHSNGEKLSKACILQRSAEYMRVLNDEKDKLTLKLQLALAILERNNLISLLAEPQAGCKRADVAQKNQMASSSGPSACESPTNHHHQQQHQPIQFFHQSHANFETTDDSRQQLTPKQPGKSTPTRTHALLHTSPPHLSDIGAAEVAAAGLTLNPATAWLITVNQQAHQHQHQHQPTHQDSSSASSTASNSSSSAEMASRSSRASSVDTTHHSQPLTLQTMTAATSSSLSASSSMASPLRPLPVVALPVSTVQSPNHQPISAQALAESLSRRNLYTIVEAINHVEGQKIIDDGTTQMNQVTVPKSTLCSAPPKKRRYTATVNTDDEVVSSQAQLQQANCGSGLKEPFSYYGTSSPNQSVIGESSCSGGLVQLVKTEPIISCSPNALDVSSSHSSNATNSSATNHSNLVSVLMSTS